MNLFSKEHVVLVDEFDTPQGEMEKMECHRKGLLHRAVSVFILNYEGKMLLQKRALHKYHSKGLWSNACCTHPALHEPVIDAAHRRLEEEMGMTCKLEKLYEYVYSCPLEDDLSESEYDHIYIGFTNEVPVINKEEVMDWRYESLQSIEQDIFEHENRYSYWFKELFPLVKDYVEHVMVR